MKIGLKPKNLIEWIALKANLVPVPLVHGVGFFVASKSILLAFKFNILETVKDSPKTLEQIAQITGFHPKSLLSLMNILIYFEYLKYKDNKYDLTKISREWCLKDSPKSLYNYQRFFDIMWDKMNYLEEFLKTGKGIDIHDTFNEEDWHWYQLGMVERAGFTLKTAGKITPMPNNPTEMLDIGGSHGLYSIELCKKYPSLKATILDLPEAVEKARPIFEKSNVGMGDRINYWIGNALTDDFSENKYDLILVSNLMHHFSEEQNIALCKKVAKALKPNGYFVMQEHLESDPFVNLVFNLESTSKTWKLSELKDFQSKAGLIHYKFYKFKEVAGFVQICARKV